jgi:hypothetical protein
MVAGTWDRPVRASPSAQIAQCDRPVRTPSAERAAPAGTAKPCTRMSAGGLAEIPYFGSIARGCARLPMAVTSSMQAMNNAKPSMQVRGLAGSHRQWGTAGRHGDDWIDALCAAVTCA